MASPIPTSCSGRRSTPPARSTSAGPSAFPAAAGKPNLKATLRPLTVALNRALLNARRRSRIASALEPQGVAVTSASELDTDFAMPLADAMSTQRAIRRSARRPRRRRSRPPLHRARHPRPDRQQPPGLGVRGRPRPRGEAPARPAQPPGLVGVPPARLEAGPQRPVDAQDRRRRSSGRRTTSRRFRWWWWPASTAGRPCSARRCSRPPTTARSSRPSRTCCWPPGPRASAPPSPRFPSGQRRLARRTLGLPRIVSPVAVVPLGWPQGGYGPTTRRPVEEVVHVDRYGHQPFLRTARATAPAEAE